MKSSRCKTSKSKRPKRQTVSGTSRIKWTSHKDPGGKWANDHPSIHYELNPTRRFKCYIYIQKTPKKFGGSKGHNWVLRDRTYSYNVVMPGVNGTWTTLKECKKRSMFAYILYFVARLLRNTDDPRIIDGEFHDV